MALATQKTKLFCVDPGKEGTPGILTVGEATAVEGIDAPISAVDSTNLQSDHRTFTPGIAEPASASITLNFDPADASAVRMHALRNARAVMHWALAFSDGEDALALAMSGANFDMAAVDRTVIYWHGFMTSFPFSANVNEVVTSQIGIQLIDIPQLVIAEAAQ